MSCTNDLFSYNFKSVDLIEAKKSFIISRLITYKVVAFSLFKREVRFVKLLQELKYPQTHAITDEKLSCHHLWARIVYIL